ncbi:MAG TPA: HDIG domain-containing protein [Candidatus Pullichristensenella excrementigallinarum]|uniref:HDIG domain-containing protein n=1 Tax=Candidatus Pullichristensenella excrementigallinarum TaxID=2840907 RepID=A0A9D1IDN1_9FIRM|nr:HDIG domain-containing protein [Candidatus Pullichristensenella excrementigallinarum]
MIPSREQAWTLLTQYNQDAHLLNHAKAVEGVMRHFARLAGEDEELWGVVGLLHDLDYEKYPQEHCKKTLEILDQAGVDAVVSRGCASHGHGVCIDLPPESRMEKTLFTIDELTGLITAVAIMRPSKSVMDLELKSVKKKYKTRAFAAGVDRDLIEKGAQMLEMPLDTVIEETILGMREVAQEIGL